MHVSRRRAGRFGRGGGAGGAAEVAVAVAAEAIAVAAKAVMRVRCVVGHLRRGRDCCRWDLMAVVDGTVLRRRLFHRAVRRVFGIGANEQLRRFVGKLNVPLLRADGEDP